MKSLFYMLCVLVFCSGTHVALAQTTFYHTYGIVQDGGEGRNVKQAIDGGYFLSYYYYYAGRFITCVTKLNCAGEKEWAKHFDCGYTTMPNELIPKEDKGCLLTLSIKRGANWEASVVRLNGIGDQLWACTFPMQLSGPVGSCAEAADGSIYVCGGIKPPSGTTGTGLAKLNQDGQLTWLKHYYDQGYHTPRALAVTSDNAVVVTGIMSFNSQPFSELFFLLIDKNGNVIKRRVMGTYYDDEPWSVCTDESGNIYATGYSYFINSAWDAMFVKLNSNLDILQSRFYDGAGMQGEQARYILRSADNTITIFGDEGGFNERNLMLIHLNESGSVQWAKSYPVSPLFTNYCFQGSQCIDGGFLMTGDVRPPSQYRIAPIIKTKADGDARCFTNTFNPAERTEPFTQQDTLVLMITVADTVDETLIPVVDYATTETKFCDHILPCGYFTKAGETCPQVCLNFTDHSLKATEWKWTFAGGNPATYNGQFPPEVCYETGGQHQVTLELSNDKGTTTLVQQVSGTPDCPVLVPTIFSPNEDGVNDWFMAINVKEEFSLQIFNRWGEEVYAADYPGKWWDGKTGNGAKAIDGVYFYVLKLKEKQQSFHGFVQLVR